MRAPDDAVSAVTRVSLDIQRARDQKRLQVRKQNISNARNSTHSHTHTHTSNSLKEIE